MNNVLNTSRFRMNLDLSAKMQMLNFLLGNFQRHRQNFQKRAKYLHVVVKMGIIAMTMTHRDEARVKLLKIDYFKIFLYADAHIILILHTTHAFHSKK